MLKGRLEDDRMLTGRGKYVSDWNLPGQAYGHFIRSDRAHAAIVSLDATAALAQPDAESFSPLPSTQSISGMDVNVCGSVCAAQPVTMIFARSEQHCGR